MVNDKSINTGEELIIDDKVHKLFLHLGHTLHFFVFHYIHCFMYTLELIYKGIVFTKTRLIYLHFLYIAIQYKFNHTLHHHITIYHYPHL